LQEILVPGQPWQEAPVGKIHAEGPVFSLGGGYVTELDAAELGNVWFIKRQNTPRPLAGEGQGVRALGSGTASKNGEKKIVARGLNHATGVALSPDQSLLYVGDGRSHWVYSYQIRPDGTLTHKQRYYHLHVPDTADDSGAGGMCVDRNGRLYVATRMGIQICDQAGRVNCILPTPGPASDVFFGGEKLDTLYAECGGRIFQRQVKVQGVDSSQPPLKPAPPKL
jgi:sugar lactone lactonase YvrE